jgi:NAD(P)-dependent dehydrogenase (short-subunit alcohol dehydrogenase family)
VFELGSRVALVTGAGQGVGAGIARRLAAQGAGVAVNDLYPERAEATARALRDTGGRAVALPFDVTDPAAVAAGVREAAAALGEIDILVNNAGIPEGMAVAPFRELDPAHWRRYVDLNLYGVLHCTRAVVDGMCTRRFGRVITISSGAGQIGIRLGVSLYGAGKGAAIAFMRHLAIECARDGVTANTLALGLMSNQQDTPETAPLAGTVRVSSRTNAASYSISHRNGRSATVAARIRIPAIVARMVLGAADGNRGGPRSPSSESVRRLRCRRSRSVPSPGDRGWLRDRRRRHPDDAVGRAHVPGPRKEGFAARTTQS